MWSLSIRKCSSLAPELGTSTLSLFQGLVRGERQALARAITLVESTHKKGMAEARSLIEAVEKRGKCKNSFRIGLSGPPGAGKSTFIETFGQSLTSSGHKVAVLAVDPSSGTTGGSLLADKTRMPELTRNPDAFIRPSPNRGHLGGVTRNTNEAILLCECAGYDIILIETVGVGQSEYMVSDMVDMFCLLIPPAGGDELQGIKRGIVEQCDMIIVNKCDGDLIPAARRIKSDYTSALKYMRPKNQHWKPKVKMMSSKTGEGLEKVWETMLEYQTKMEDNGVLKSKRAEQRTKWMWSYIQNRLFELFSSHPKIKGHTAILEEKVRNYDISPGNAADLLLEKFQNQE